ncbi:Protein of unknown function [Cotesia congregata]|uniref:Uncharacterized protein n=1 Tax=Cotesia congregata TaxID=51543 RepID=A0A8J2MJZ4_COTCN|nr:Protein of unknown function [Cotesia congregata]
MFILKCKRDDSVCKVDDSEVIYNEDSPPKDGEDVKFYYGDKQELGQVIMMSDYIKKINTKFEQIKQSLMKRTRPSSSPKIEKESVSTKRTRKINSKYTSLSFENMDLLKLPKVRKSEKKEIKDDNRKKDCGSSPSKDELKKQLAKLQKEIKNSKKSDVTTEQLDDDIAFTSHTEFKKKNYNTDFNSATESDTDDSLSNVNDQKSSDVLETSENDESRHESKILKGGTNNKENNAHNITADKTSPDEETTEKIIDDCNDSDLWGKDWPGEPMCKLMNKIYCKETEYRMCKSLCNQASHVVRRLIPEVFKPSGYLTATLTGQAPRAHVQEGKLAPMKALNSVAKNEIIDFALALAKNKKWMTPKGVPQTREQLASVMSQRIGELKRADHYCFLWCIVAALYPVKAHRNLPSSYPYPSSVLDHTGITFPIELKDIPSFEKMNDLRIKVYGIEPKQNEEDPSVIVPLYLSSNLECQKDAIHLLMIETNLTLNKDDSIENHRPIFHFAWIRNLSRLVGNTVKKGHWKVFFCDRCLCHFNKRHHSRDISLIVSSITKSE